MSILGWCSLYVIIGCLGLIWERRLAEHSSILREYWRLSGIDTTYMYLYIWSFSNMVKWVLFWPVQLGLRVCNYSTYKNKIVVRACWQVYWMCTKEALNLLKEE